MVILQFNYQSLTMGRQLHRLNIGLVRRLD